MGFTWQSVAELATSQHVGTELADWRQLRSVPSKTCRPTLFWGAEYTNNAKCLAVYRKRAIFAVLNPKLETK